MSTPTVKPPPARISVRARRGAQELGVSETAFWRRARTDPTFPTAFKVGTSTTLWYLDELAAWRDAHRVAKATPAPVKAHVLAQLRNVLADQGSLVELQPGGNVYLITLAVAPAAASQVQEAGG